MRAGHAEEGGVKVGRPSFVALADAVGRELGGARNPALFSDEPFQYLLDWRLREEGVLARPLLTPPDELLSPTAGAALDAWLELNACEVVIVIDSPRKEAPRVRGFAGAPLAARLTSSGAFATTSRQTLEVGGPVTVEILRRRSRS